jgi:hypothetical protein
MTGERRDFIKLGTAVAAGLVNAGLGWAQSSPSNGELESGTGTLRLEGRLKAGLLKLQARDFVGGKDRALIVEGKLDSIELYNAMFSHHYDRTVFAILRDSGHSTSLVLSDTDDPTIGRLVVWNDAAPPEVFRVDKKKAVDEDDPRESILDDRGKMLDLVGKRKPPAFTLRELETVFGKDTALLEFMRGRRPAHHPTEDKKADEYACRILGAILGSLLGLMWRP